MTRLAALPLILFLTVPALGQDIRLPVLPPPPPPPSVVTKLAADQLYVIEAKVQCIVMASPAALLKISSETGPIRIRGKFVDGSGKIETRAYDWKYVYIVEAAGTGKVELIIVPPNATEKDIIRVCLDVSSDPGPGPGPGPDAFTKSLQDAYNLDTDASKADYLSKLAALYRQAAILIADDKLAPQIPTYGVLLSKMKTAEADPKLGIPPTAIKGVRAIIDADLKATFGTNAAAPVDRPKTIAEFNKIATALGGVK